MRGFRLIGLSLALAVSSLPAVAENNGLLHVNWQATIVKQEAVLDQAPVLLSFDDNHAFSGTGGCNRFKGQFVSQPPHLAVGPVTITRKKCELEVMKQEQRLLSILSLINTYSLQQGVLTLEDPDGEPLLQAVRSE